MAEAAVSSVSLQKRRSLHDGGHHRSLELCLFLLFCPITSLWHPSIHYERALFLKYLSETRVIACLTALEEQELELEELEIEMYGSRI